MPDYGWTTQKVFHLLNFVFCVIRCVSFSVYTLLQDLNDDNDKEVVVKLIVFDLPGTVGWLWQWDRSVKRWERHLASPLGCVPISSGIQTMHPTVRAITCGTLCRAPQP